MAKFEEAFEDTQKIFDSLIQHAELNRVVDIELRVNNKQKEIYSVTKNNDFYKHETKKDVYIIINEKIFEQLEDWQQVMIAEEAITTIVFDAEKDKLTLKKGDVGITKVGAFSGILSKYGADRYEVLQESIKTLYQAEKEEADVDA